jgi:hypothetical protein
MMEETIKLARRISARLKPSRKFQPLKPVDWMPDRAQVWVNDLYEVTARPHDNGWPFGGGEWAQLGISSLDGEPRHDWRDFQAIKNQLCGEDWEAIELYPSESRLVDPSNYYILWCAPKIPIGMNNGRTINTPANCIAPQRGWPKGAEPVSCINHQPPNQNEHLSKSTT